MSTNRNLLANTITDLQSGETKSVKDFFETVTGVTPDDSVDRVKLKNYYSYNGTAPTPLLQTSVNEGIYSGNVASGYTDLPTDDQLSGSDTFVVECFDTLGNERFIMQRLTHWSVPDRSWIRRVDTVNNVATAWLRVDATNLSNDDLSSQYIYRGSITTGSMNQAFEDGTYTVVASGVTEEPDGIGNFLFRNTLHGTNYQLQEAIDLNNPTLHYQRVNRPLLGTPVFTEWVRVDKISKIANKNVVFIGDSITESYNMPFFFKELTGANVFNYGIGGTRLGRHTSAGYEDLSGFKIAQAISSGDWTTVISGGVITGDVAQTEGLRDTDWNTVDYLVVGYGTNDFGGGVTIGTINDTNEFYFYATVDILIKEIISTYPHLKILFWCPPWRGNTPNDPAGIVGGSDVSTNTLGNFLTDYNDVIVEKCKQYKQEVLDLYHVSGITEETKAYYLTDLLHPTQDGSKHIAGKLASTLESRF